MAFSLDSDTVKDCAELPAAVNAASHLQCESRKMAFMDHDRCESACDSAFGSECFSSSCSVSDKFQDLHIHGKERLSSEGQGHRENASGPFESIDSSERTVQRPQKRPIEEAHDDVVLTSDAYDQDEEGDTPLGQAIIYEKPEIALRFIKYTPDPSFFNIRNCLGQTPLMLSVLTNQVEVCRALVVAGASVDVQDQEGNTALHLACRFNFQLVHALTSPINEVEIKKVLSPRNHRSPQDLTSQLSLKNYEGLTCLHLGTLSNNINLLKYLVAIGANVNEPDGKSGRTALHYAVEMNHFHLVQCLLSDLGANVDAVTFDLCTPLHLAVGRGHEAIAYLLHGAGADTQVQNYEGQCACELTDNTELQELLSPFHQAGSIDYFY